MTGADVAALRAADPDLVLLVGGTDGGNADVLLHNAERIAKARLHAPVVVAGNAEAADEVAALLSSTGRRHVVTANVLPRIGVVAPEAARSAIREAFLDARHRRQGTLARPRVRRAGARPHTGCRAPRRRGARRGRGGRRARRRRRRRHHRRLLGDHPPGRGRHDPPRGRRHAVARPHRRGRPRHAVDRRGRRRRRRARAAPGRSRHRPVRRRRRPRHRPPRHLGCRVGGRGGDRLDRGGGRGAPPRPAAAPVGAAAARSPRSSLVVGSGGVLRHAPGDVGRPGARPGHRRPRRRVAGARDGARCASTRPTCCSPWGCSRTGTRPPRRPWRDRWPRRRRG